VQHFDEPTLWEEIGYRVIAGQLQPGQQVTLKRKEDSYPDYFEALLTLDDAIVSKIFEDEMAQAEWVAQQVRRNLEIDELDYDDILIILPNALTAKKRVVPIRDALNRNGIDSHLAGVTSSADEMFSSRSVAISNIYRAKGNEAPMVYVLNCQHCMADYEQIKLRNTLFTAITRSRAWLRLCGFGPDMKALRREVDNVRQMDFRLQFAVPTEAQLAKIRMIHRDRTAGEKDKIRRATLGLAQFLEAVRNGDLEIETLPANLRGRLKELLGTSGEEDNDG
jgi:superfamily I DNA and RNA helicase